MVTLRPLRSSVARVTVTEVRDVCTAGGLGALTSGGAICATWYGMVALASPPVLPAWSRSATLNVQSPGAGSWRLRAASGADAPDTQSPAAAGGHSVHCADTIGAPPSAAGAAQVAVTCGSDAARGAMANCPGGGGGVAS